MLPIPAGANRVATVNGKVIPRTRVDAVVKQQAARGIADSEQLRKAVIDRLINFELVAQEADRRGLARTADVQMQIEVARQQVLFEAYMQDYFKAKPISEASLRAEYDKVRQQRGDREFKARHVLVESESEARNIIDQLGKGGKIEELAKQSKDGGSRERGGDLGWQAAGTFVKPFADALSKLEKGKFTTQPVQSPFGWHVILLEDVRTLQFPGFDQVKPQIQSVLQEQEIQKVFADLRAKAKIE
ncbi:MAG: peptidylprolyl isomerase [Betaproteobacteria bacterium RIFCSPLOWO2_02_FULL_62_17]|nr:MAG: peptidylprolyl isomerase [Betaproteobacteria bacterium RIFCSPLOWO2_02_FULL_62_17]